MRIGISRALAAGLLLAVLTVAPAAAQASLLGPGAALDPGGAALIPEAPPSAVSGTTSTSAVPDWTENRTGGFRAYASGDFNGDGYMDLAIGASAGTVASGDNGAVIFHYGSASGLATAITYQYNSPQAGAFAGYSVAAGDFNADGFDDLAIGLPAYDGAAGANEGLVVVLLGRASGMPQEGWRSPSGGAQAGGHLGYNVATGDVNGDGRADLLVAAPYYDKDATDDGLVSLFMGTSTGLSNNAAWTVWGGTQNRMAFGEAVSCCADLDGDGLDDLAVGAPSYDEGTTTDVGLVAVFRGNRSLVSTSPYRLVKGTTSSGFFGRALAFARGFDGNRTSLFVGAANYTGATAGEGAVSRYTNGTSGLDAREVIFGAGPSAGFGSSLQGGLDWNGDGREDVVAGQPFLNNLSGQLSALTYGTGPARLTIQAGAAGTRLGEAVGVLRKGRKDTRGGAVGSLVSGSNVFYTAAPTQSATTAGVRLIHNVGKASGFSIRFVMKTDNNSDGTYETTAVDVIVGYTESQKGAPFVPNVPVGVPAQVTASVVQKAPPNDPVPFVAPVVFTLPANTFQAGKNYRAMAGEDKNGTTGPGRLCQNVALLGTNVCLSYGPDLPVPTGKNAIAQVSMALWHGVADAGAVEVRFADTGAIIATNLNPADPPVLLLVDPGTYRIQVIQRSTGTTLGIFAVDLTGQAGQVADVVLKGYLQPQNNASPLGGTPPSLGAAEVTETGSSTPTGVRGETVQSAAFGLLGIMPNPASGAATLAFDLPSTGTVTVEVFDVVGRRVLSVPTVALAAGVGQRQAFDVSELPAGVYVVRLTVGTAGSTATQTAPLTILR